MFFYHLDSQAHLHQTILIKPSDPILDIDLHWINFGHRVYPERLHGMACFEKIASEIPEEHQFTYRTWYDSRISSTQCIWYSIPKWLLKIIPDQNIQAKSLPFVLHRFFPPSCRNKSVVCFVDLVDCESVVGYVRGQCVCFKKLPPRAQLNAHHEWQYLQQAYPQWFFEHSLYLTSNESNENLLSQTHHHTIHLDPGCSLLSNRMKLYGIG